MKQALLENIPRKTTIVGAGPAGLSAGVYAATEGLGAIEIEGPLPAGAEELGPFIWEAAPDAGGQAGTTSDIQNLVGFPDGISGPELADRAELQVRRHGATLIEGARATNLRRLESGLFEVSNDSLAVQSLSVILAMGVGHRELDLEGVQDFRGRGIEYGHPNHKGDYTGKEWCVVGGANSAGQAAIFLAERGCKVTVLVRKPSIDIGMSQYLCERIDDEKNVTVRTQAEVTGIVGDDEFEGVKIVCNGEEDMLSVQGLSILIGSKPGTEWLPDEIELDSYGYIPTGRDISSERRAKFEERYKRLPFNNETSMAGVFAAGDGRSEVQRRIASAVGDGADAVSDVHRYLATL